VHHKKSLLPAFWDGLKLYAAVIFYSLRRKKNKGFVFFVYCGFKTKKMAEMMSELEKFTLEFQLKTTPKLLFTLISTPEGLSRWFADQVVVVDDVFHFKWQDSEQTARLVQSKDNNFVKFQWLDDFHKDMILEMQIVHEAVSSEVGLIVTDYAESGDLDFSQRLWNTQVGQLQRLFNS
jgi:uncharacterized protein YndB with AHSA1/START domain